eukprot:CCRYP_005044-RA/>CCRYP_005044-RA protein AED:0.07 eAED:0.07 QI:83/1/1/1/0.5/0.66/3/18/360
MTESELESCPSTPPAGCSDEDFLHLIDLCPFLASDKTKYNDGMVLSLLRKNPRVACLRASFRRLGIGTNLHPLPLVVALGGSLDVVKIMVEACPEALGERLSGRRNLLHYAISEGVDIQVIRYLVTQYPQFLYETDSYNAIPLHLASTYPSSSLSVLQLLLHLHPNGAKAIDNKSQTPLHRACKSRAPLEKIMVLVAACPDVLSWRDWCGNTPLGLADRMDHRLGDVHPEVVELLEWVEEVLRLDMEPHYNPSNINNLGETILTPTSEERQRAQEILARFHSMRWYDGISMAFFDNTKLFTLLGIPTPLIHKFLSLICGSKSTITIDDSTNSDINRTNRLKGLFSLLRQHPLFFCRTPNK